MHQAMKTSAYPHIELDADGVPLIAGTTTKVVEIVQDHLAHHWHAEDIHKQYPYLGMAQIHAALAYYYDHQTEMDQDIERRWQRALDIKNQHSDTSNQEKLRLLGFLP